MERGICLVCTVPITITNLGLDVCRACAAFFKRTVLANRKYTCRQGDGKCTFRKHEKFMCRSCRYDKCAELGMTYDFRPKKIQSDDPEVADISVPSLSRESSTCLVSDRLDSDPMSLVNSTICDSPLPSNCLLDRMESEYKTAYERRLVQEKEFVTKQRLKPYAHASEEFYIANLLSFYELYRIVISDSTLLLKNVFEDFERIPIVHRVVLFKNFVIKFSMLEWVYLTGKYFENTNFMATSFMTCAEIGNIDQWMIKEENIVRQEAFRTTLTGFADDFLAIFIPMTKMGKLTEREFYALVVLSYCDVDNSLQLPQEVTENLEKIRAQLFTELQQYYRNELGIVDFSQRIGNLMTMTHCAGEAGILTNEEMLMYATMFGLYADDQMFREFFTDS